MTRNTKQRELVWVKLPTPYAAIKYGFNSGADAGDKAILGQTAVTAADVTGLVIGANNIKPGKATKLKATGSESSFYSDGTATALKAAGWKLTRPKISSYRTSSRSELLYVTINGVKYGWRSAKSSGARPAGADGLGIKSVTTSKDVIYGCSFPKPPRATAITPDGNSFSTFVDPSKADKLPDGWSLAGSGKTALLV